MSPCTWLPVLLSINLCCSAVITAEEPACGYKSCTQGDPEKLNVHIIAHSHDDVGWVETVDEYYNGPDENFPGGVVVSVRDILDTVVAALHADAKRRFMYVEMAFFHRWWHEQNSSTQSIVRDLVTSGRLEFVIGGWCMNDEATTHYNAIIDQLTLGLKFLQKTFGECARPRVAWQIDPFGHSKEQASIFAQMGYDGLFIGRLDYQDKAKRLDHQTMEMIWQASDNLGDQASLFTGINFGGYYPPPGFCFDARCSDRIMDENKDTMVDQFISYIRQQAASYATNHILVTMGGDFHYVDASVNFEHTDKLIQYINERNDNITIFYSTPNCYLAALNQANTTYPNKSDDFFPYADQEHRFWTGFFTSRPNLKYYIRQANNFLQVCKQLQVLSGVDEGAMNDKLEILKEALGVVQHHDAITGTETQAVTRDYIRQLAEGFAAGQELIQVAFNKLMLKGSTPVPRLHFCSMTNISMCNFTETNDGFVVIIYNPIARNITYWVNIPVRSSNYVVTDSQQNTLTSQVLPVTNQTVRIPERVGNASYTVAFRAVLPALGLTTYFVRTSGVADTPDSEVSTDHPDSPSDETISIQNDHLKLEFDRTGKLNRFVDLEHNRDLLLQQDLLFYNSWSPPSEGPASGAYVFRPMNKTSEFITDNVQIFIERGPLVQEVHQVFSGWASQVIRLRKGEPYFEIEWTLGPLPIDDGFGKEVVSQFHAELDNEGVYFTDANGREIQRRKRDFRPTWTLNQTEPIAGNYYPINSRIYIQDVSQDIQLTLLTDRSQGGGSLRDGDVEVMLHRRLLEDDGLGVNQALNETGVDGQGIIARGTHYVFLESIPRSAGFHRDLAERLFMSPLLTFSGLQNTAEDYEENFVTTWSGMKIESLPQNIHLLTLEQWDTNKVLLRLEHFYEKDEDDALSTTQTVSLEGLFEPFSIESAEEMTLGANQKLSEAKRLIWSVQDEEATKSDMFSFVTPVSDDLQVQLEPMQIRTFLLTIKML